MALPDELLEVAQLLAESCPATAPQAALRRAVSTAYYALFHLLISDATANWAQPDLRAALGRCFDHGPMRTASDTIASRMKTATGDERLLCAVAAAFVRAQQNRRDADYDMAREWTAVQARDQIVLVRQAFEDWRAVRGTPAAQAYLVLMLTPKERGGIVPRMPASGAA